MQEDNGSQLLFQTGQLIVDLQKVDGSQLCKKTPEIEHVGKRERS